MEIFNKLYRQICLHIFFKSYIFDFFLNIRIKEFDRQILVLYFYCVRRPAGKRYMLFFIKIINKKDAKNTTKIALKNFGFNFFLL